MADGAFVLRQYQREAVDRGLAYLTDPKLAGRHGIIVAPTASGKSLLVANLAQRLPGPCVVLQPTREILQQNAAKLAAYGYPPALYSASVGRKEIGAVTLATIGSVVRHIKDFAHFSFVLIDECHLVSAKGGMYADFLALLGRVRCLGLTASPFRLHSNSFGSTLRFLTRTRPRIFRDVVHYTQIGDLARDGYLAPVEYRVKPVIAPERLRPNSTGADYSDRSVQLAFREVGFETKLEAEVRQLLEEGRKHVLIFTRFVAEAERLAKTIPGCAVVSGDTPDRERAALLEAFQAGRIRAIANAKVLTIGYDFPALDTVVLASPTMSLALYYQEAGRCLRTAPGKTGALVVDLVGAVKQFGPVHDLVLRPGGKKGESWEFVSRGRVLTNVIFGAPDEKQQQKAEYWKRRRGYVAEGRGRAQRADNELF